MRFGTRVRNAGLGNFWKSRVRVRQDSAIKKLLKIFLFIFYLYFLYIFTIKIFLKNTLLCLDSQNKERRRQETHYYASEVGISTVLARFKADFGCFGRRPIRPDMADTAQFGRINSVQRESKPSQRESEREKKKKAQTRHRLAGNRVELGCGTLPAAAMLSSLTVKINK